MPNIQELYLFNRAGLLRDIKIERASEKHLDAVKRLTEHFSAREKILNDYYDAVRSRKRSVSVSKVLQVDLKRSFQDATHDRTVLVDRSRLSYSDH